MKLYVIPTPIGNLEDITLRAINTLKSVDTIVAEDTRKASLLLTHLGITQKNITSHHTHNEHHNLQKIITLLQGGKTVGLISEAGTPGISDPGFLLIRECVKNNIAIETLPGACACITALVNSGLPCDKFVFEGFLPLQKGRSTRLKTLSTEPRTIIFYESPHRLLKTLEQFVQTFGSERPAAVCRELTKIYEETLRGTTTELLEHFKNKTIRGEFVIIVGGYTKP